MNDDTYPLAGLIGSHILTEPHEHGHEVTALLRDAAQADIAEARGATPARRLRRHTRGPTPEAAAGRSTGQPRVVAAGPSARSESSSPSRSRGPIRRTGGRRGGHARRGVDRSGRAEQRHVRGIQGRSGHYRSGLRPKRLQPGRPDPTKPCSAPAQPMESPTCRSFRSAPRSTPTSQC
jgi:hypothetical protein